jgi:hypothetical protein
MRSTVTGGRRLWAFTCAFFLLLVMMAEVRAFEFNVSGVTTMAHVYYSQQGTKGFFGPNNKDSSGAATFYTANAWLGYSNIVSGSDGASASVSTLLYPSFTVNRGLTLAGVYQIGNSFINQYPGQASAFAVGQWMQWWLTANLPWGLVSYGKRPFSFGCGLQFDAGSRTQEHLALVSYIGPFSIGLGAYPYRMPSWLDDVGERAYPSVIDKSAVPTRDLFGFIHYESGPMETGIGGTYYASHQGPESFIPATRSSVAPVDVEGSEGWVFFRYNNGRFFINAEGDWTYRLSRFQGSLDGLFLHASFPGAGTADNLDGSGSMFKPQYTEGFRFMTELGAFAGPLKFSLLYAFVPGPDRRHGVLIDRQPGYVDLFRPYVSAPVTPVCPGIVYIDPDQGNASVFRPYSTILCGTYGCGSGYTLGPLGIATFRSMSIGRDQNGQVTDANVYAARIDYAVAANLNLYTSFVKAERVSDGYGWGFIRPSGDGLLSYWVDYSRQGTFLAPTPNIPDKDLGWEVDAGVDWNILEGWQLSVNAGYWRPGRWFNFACVDKTVPGWDAPVAGNFWGTNPNREIVPVFQMNWVCSTSF